MVCAPVRTDNPRALARGLSTVQPHKPCTMISSVDCTHYRISLGWSGGAMVLGKLPVPGRPTILITVGQGPIALAVGAGGSGLDIFTLIYHFISFSLSLGDGLI